MKPIELFLDIASIFLCVFIFIFILLTWKELPEETEFEEVPVCPIE